MHDIPNRIANVLLEVEANLRTSGQWEKKQPPMSALASSEPFCIDTGPENEWIFNAHKLEIKVSFSCFLYLKVLTD